MPRRLSIRAKLLGSAGLLITLMLVVGVVGEAQLRNVADNGKALYTTDLEGSRWAADLERTLSEQQLAIHVALASRTEASMARADRVVDESRASIRDGIAQLDGLDGFAATAQLRAFETAWKRQDALLLRARRLSGTSPGRATALFNGEQQSAVTAALRSARLLGTAAEGNARARSREMQDVYASSSLFLLGSIALAAILGLGIAFLISRGIQRSVEDILDRLRSLGANCVAGLRDGLGDLAHGDLTSQVVPVTTPIDRIAGDELGDVARTVNAIREDLVRTIDAYNETRAGLGGMIATVTTSAQTLSAASQQMAATSEDTGRAVGEIAHAVGDIADGAQRQVEALESARAVAEQVTTATVASAESAGEAATVAAGARAAATEGTEVVGRATTRWRPSARRPSRRPQRSGASARSPSASAASSTPSPASPSRRTSSRSTRRSRRRAQATRAAASPSSPTRSASSPRAPSRLPRASRSSSARSSTRPRRPCPSSSTVPSAPRTASRRCCRPARPSRRSARPSRT